MVTHIVDLGLNVQDIENSLVTTGYWGSESRRERHACILSPSAYVLHEEQQVTGAAKALYAGVVRLEATLAELSHQRQLDHSQSRFLRMAKSAAHGLLGPGEDSETAIPPIVKIDMARDGKGAWHTVEVDTYNPRALGTIALVDVLVKSASKDPAFCMVSQLAKMLGNEPEWIILVSEKERYYGTSYEILSARLRKVGVRTRLVTESEARDDPSLFRCRDGPLHLFVIPESMDRHPVIRDYLMAGYRTGSVRTLYPPKAYLGSKAFLPFIASQRDVNGWVPATALLTGNIENCNFSRSRTSDRIILKSVHSSGSKGIIRQDDPTSFTKTIAQGAGSKTPLWIAQEEVPQEPIPITVFEGKRRVVMPYYLRLTIYATTDGIAGMKITGRPEKIVHGAPDCIQLPVIRRSVWQDFLPQMS